ncbi:MAG: hypothetical protein QGG60_07850 [Anaerolineales bacterium]|nr:hypothetical protein [Anaerolineales bacterium]
MPVGNNIIPRDIQPDNLLVSAAGVVVSGFGFAQTVSGADITRPGFSFGGG